jgi:hypothetical protein
MATRESRWRVLLYESLGFALILIALWLDELLDLPRRILGSPATPINAGEILVESMIVVPVAILVVVSTAQLLRRVRQLEGLLQVCAFCARVRDGDRWVAMDEYIESHSKAEVAQSLCHDCLRRQFTAGDSQAP